MPELPEVEVTRRGIANTLQGARVSAVQVRNAALRWPVPADLAEHLVGHVVSRVCRRAKYLLVEFAHGTLLLHLGMSGSLRIVASALPPEKHDHFDLVLGDRALRLRDPRRFGAVLWHVGDIYAHPLLASLGPEPLDPAFNGAAWFAATRGLAAPIKNVLMDAHRVVGVGNIYANESLFQAAIDPRRAAGRVSAARCERLADEVKRVLRRAIEAGGSTLRDFVHSDGSAGYFQQEYAVYGRAGQSCQRCDGTIKVIRVGQRSTFFCQR